MEPHHETGFPATLCRWVEEIVQSSPEAARLTVLELIVGAVLASGSHVTQAILALTPVPVAWTASKKPAFTSRRGRIAKAPLSARLPARKREIPVLGRR